MEPLFESGDNADMGFPNSLTELMMIAATIQHGLRNVRDLLALVVIAVVSLIGLAVVSLLILPSTGGVLIVMACVCAITKLLLNIAGFAARFGGEFLYDPKRISRS